MIIIRAGPVSILPATKWPVKSCVGELSLQQSTNTIAGISSLDDGVSWTGDLAERPSLTAPRIETWPCAEIPWPVELLSYEHPLRGGGWSEVDKEEISFIEILFEHFWQLYTIFLEWGWNVPELPCNERDVVYRLMVAALISQCSDWVTTLLHNNQY